MRFFVLLTFVLIGIGRNLPFQQYYFHGLGLGDFLLGLLSCYLFLFLRSRHALYGDLVILRLPIQAIVCLSVIAMVSMAFNAPIYGVDGKDLFEALKYFYLLLVMVVTCYCTRQTGAVPTLGFVIGVIISGVVALLNPMNPDVLGTPQIFNPNVIGNVLAVSVVFCSFAILRGHAIAGGALAVGSAVISFFTFSKGTWLMTVLAMACCYLAMNSLGSLDANRALKYGKYLGMLMLAGLLYVVIEFWEVVSVIVEAKIAATDFDASAAAGGSFSARFGLILSAIYMFLSNPLLGVGISNYEEVNHLLQGELGDSFYDDDNPNSAWFYVLSCMGLPAFILFCLVFYWYLKQVRRLPLSSAGAKAVYTFCLGGVFFIGGSVQLEMLTAYYYWVALGIVAGSTTSPVTVRHDSARLDSTPTGAT